MINRPANRTVSFQDSNFRITFPEPSKPVDVSELVLDNYKNITSFNYFLADFGLFFDATRNSNIEITDQINHDKISLMSSNDQVKVAFEKIKHFANLGEDEPIITDPNQAEELLSSYEIIFSTLNEEFRWLDSDAFIVPLKGGGIVARLFDLPGDKVIHLNAKRLPLKDQRGHFSFGMNVGYGQKYNTVEKADEFMNSLDGKEVTMLEVCVASGMTTFGFILDLYLRGIKPKVVQVLTAAVSLQGVELVCQLAKELDIEVHFITGKIVTRLADHYIISQDSLLDDDGKLVVLSPARAYELVEGKKII